MPHRNEVLNLAPRDITVQHTEECKRIGKTQVRFALNRAGALTVIAHCPSCGVVPIQPER